jgi:hypothetical protein
MNRKSKKTFLQSIDKDDIKYEILKYDDKTKIATLKGQYARFQSELTKDYLTQCGYKIIKEDA